MKFDLDKIARIAEIGTAVVVVVSLVYIAIELDQNTRATHSASWEAVIDQMISLDTTEAVDLGIFVESAERDPAQVTEEEFWKFSRIARARLGVLEYAFLSIRNETLSDFHWGAVSGFLEHIMCMPGYQRFWIENEQIYHPEFVSYVSEVVQKCQS